MITVATGQALQGWRSVRSNSKYSICSRLDVAVGRMDPLLNTPANVAIDSIYYVTMITTIITPGGVHVTLANNNGLA